MVKKSRGVFLTLALATILIFTGCVNQSASFVPAVDITPPSAPLYKAVSAGAIELKFTSMSPPTSAVSKVQQDWASSIAEKSDGKLTVKMYFGESLVNQNETIKAIQAGITDIGYYTISTDPRLMPLNSVTNLPFLGIPNQEAAGKIQMQLLREFPEMLKEFQNMKLLWVGGVPPEQFNFTNKEVKTPEDMRGMKIIARGNWSTVMQNMGVGSINVQLGDWYASLERGLAEGLITNFVVQRSYHVLGLMKYHVTFGEGGCSQTVQSFIMNSQSWERLPLEMQELLFEEIAVYNERLLKINARDIQESMQEARDTGQIIHNIYPKERAVWEEYAQPLYEKWLSENSRHAPAQKILDRTRELIRQYSW